jgi:MarR family transcriptional regulator, negative regulator of the multidrug operon emrRAB
MHDAYIRPAGQAERAERLSNTFGALVTEVAARLHDGLVERSGLGLSDVAAVVLLSRAPRRIEDLSRILHLSHSAAVRLVDRLEDATLADRTPGEDRRSVTVRLTPSGRRRVDSLLAVREQVMSAVLSPLRSTERSELATVVERLLEELSEDWDAARHICRLCDIGTCEAHATCPTGVGAMRG